MSVLHSRSLLSTGLQEARLAIGMSIHTAVHAQWFRILTRTSNVLQHHASKTSARNHCTSEVVASMAFFGWSKTQMKAES